MAWTDVYDNDNYVSNGIKRRKEKMEKANCQLGAGLEKASGQNKTMTASVRTE